MNRQTDERHLATETRGPHPLPLFLSLFERHLGNHPERFRAALRGLKRYQQAPALPSPQPLAEVARIGGVRLLDAGGPDGARPVVVIPSIINSNRILDLGDDRSLVRFLAGTGHRVLLVDWGRMGNAERRLGLAGLVSVRLLPLLQRVKGAPALVGYCLGGTMAVAAGQLLGERLSGLALIAAPWHFSGFPDEARGDALAAWARIEPLARILGAVPISLLNPLFWSLDEEGIVRKFEALAEKAGDDPALPWFASIEDWAGSGAPIPLAAARDLFRNGFGADDFGNSRWRVRGERIAPENLAAPILDFTATRDRIAPPSTRIRGGNTRHRSIESGHVGMVIGSGAREQLWQPLSNWLHER